MDNNKYGTLINRVKAILFDLVILIGLGVSVSMLLAKFEHVPDYIRIVAFVLIFFLYDPLCTSLLGGTAGHFLMGLRVRRNNDETKKIIFPAALVRFLVKAMLGWISLLTVSGNKKKRAIHDSVAGSVVIEV
jgi:uncharacterized RDD family membrane protein YckC